MKTFTVTYDFNVFKPSNIHIYEQQKNFIVNIDATELQEAKVIFLKTYNKNPMYFKFQEN